MAVTEEAAPVDEGVAVAAVVAALVSVLGTATYLADGHRSRFGSLLSQSGIGVTVAFVLLGYAVHRPVVRAMEGAALPSYRSQVRAWLLRIVPVAWVVVVAGYLFPPATGAAMPTGSFGTAAAGSTSVPLADLVRNLLFVAPYRRLVEPGPVVHLWPVAAAVLYCLVVPALGPVLTRPFRPFRSNAAGSWVLAGGLVVTAIVWRLLASDDVGLVLWLPAHLDAFAGGIAIAVATSNERIASLLARRVSVVVGAVLAVVIVVVTSVALDDQRQQVVVVGWRGLAQHVAFVGAALAFTGPVVVAASRRRARSDRSAWARPGFVAGAIGIAYASYAWAPLVIARWVSDGSIGSDGAPAPAHRPAQLFHTAMAPLVAWTLVVTAIVAAISWFAVQRPLLRFERRPFGAFTGGLWIIGLASFATRVWSFGTATARNPGNGDPFYYHAQANMLADRVGFGEPIQWITEHRFVATAIHPPLFTLWLTPTSLLGARGFLSHKVMAGLAGVAVVVVAGFLGRRLGGVRAGLIAAALVALSPDLWIVDGTLWPEGLYTALVGLALVAAYRWRDSPTFRGAALVGAAVGAAILTRGEAVFLLPLLCLPLAWSRRKVVDRWLVHAAVMAAVALGILAPWTIRNLATFDHVVPVSTNSEEVLYYANCPDVYSGPLIGYWSFNCQERARKERVAEGLPKDPPGDESDRAAGWGKLGRAYATSHKGRWPAVAVARVTRVWDLQHADTTARALTFEGRPYDWAKRGLLAYRLTLLPGIVGLFVIWRRRRAPVWPLVAMIAMVTVTALSVYGHIRFRTVGDLVLLVSAGVAIDAVCSGRPGFRPDPEPAPAPGGAPPTP